MIKFIAIFLLISTSATAKSYVNPNCSYCQPYSYENNFEVVEKPRIFNNEVAEMPAGQAPIWNNQLYKR